MLSPAQLALQMFKTNVLPVLNSVSRVLILVEFVLSVALRACKLLTLPTQIRVLIAIHSSNKPL